MRTIQLATDIVPVATLKVQAAQVLQRLREEGRPILITQHGKPAGVLIPTEDFDRIVERERFIEAVTEGLHEAEAGQFVENEALRAELDREFGTLDDR